MVLICLNFFVVINKFIAGNARSAMMGGKIASIIVGWGYFKREKDLLLEI